MTFFEALSAIYVTAARLPSNGPAQAAEPPRYLHDLWQGLFRLGLDRDRGDRTVSPYRRHSNPAAAESGRSGAGW